ncbi:Cupredoxin [Aspergillus heterothallicus]
MFSLTTLALLALTSTTIAAPTLTTRETSSPTAPERAITHTVVAALGGSLTFSPDNVVAEIGDVVEWHFLPANHTIAQSNFANPCEPLADGVSFFPGFEFVTSNGQQAEDVFQITVQDKSPIWYYCPQAAHCQAGMSGVINQDFDGGATLAAYKRNSVGTVTVIPDEIVGEAIANPNPLGGF